MADDFDPAAWSTALDSYPRKFQFRVAPALVVLLAAAAFVSGLILLPLLDVSWPSQNIDRWVALGALGQAAAGAAAVIALLTVFFVYGQVRDTSEYYRLTTRPYMRLFVGFECGRRPGFAPPPTDDSLVTLTQRDVVDRKTLAVLSKLDVSDTEAIHHLYVWIENLQVAPLGVGLWARLKIEMFWKHDVGPEAGALEFICKYPYVQPGQPVRIELFRVGPHVENIGVVARSIDFRDVLGRKFTGATGPGRFRFDRNSPTEVVNGPVILGR